MSNTVEPRGKKESTLKSAGLLPEKKGGGAKSGNLVINTPNFVRKAR